MTDILKQLLISARRPKPINKKKKRICENVNFAVPADHRIKLKENEKRINTSTLLENWKKNKKNVEHEGDNYTNRDWCFWYSN